MRGSLARYGRLYLAFARYCLVREMNFRVNFLIRCFTGIAWLGLLILFFQLVFLKTERIGDWSREQFLVFQATSMLINAILNAIFLENLTEFSELIRTGDLDFVLTRPLDEQFAVSTRRIDWSEVPKIPFALGMIAWVHWQTPLPLTPLNLSLYALTVACGVLVMYAMLLMMAATSVWIVRNSGLYEIWFYITQFARYPSDIYGGSILGNGLNLTLTFVLPVLLAITLPARVLAGLTVDPFMTAWLIVATVAMLQVSRRFLKFALERYRSASS
jgi:ABC-2 type transport system permease protein